MAEAQGVAMITVAILINGEPLVSRSATRATAIDDARSEPEEKCPNCEGTGKIHTSYRDGTEETEDCEVCEEKQGQADSFERELQHLLNKHSIDNDCGMPDFTLAHHVGNYISSLKQPEQTACEEKPEVFKLPAGFLIQQPTSPPSKPLSKTYSGDSRQLKHTSRRGR
jgi:hypothetical protein